MSKVQILRAFLKQRVTVDAEGIPEVFVRRISECEEELCRLKEEHERQQKLLEAVFNPEVQFQTPDVQLLSKEHQGWSPSLDQDDPRPLYIKEDQEELWASEVDQGLMLKTLVKQSRPAAAEHICELFDRTIAEYKQQICRSANENKRQQKLLDTVFKPKVLLHRAGCPVDVQRLAGNSKPSKGLVQENPESRPIKEEQEEVMIKQEDEAETPYTIVPVKSEEDEEKPPSSDFHQRRTEDRTDGSELYRGSEPDRSLDPRPRFQMDPDDKTTDSSDTEDSDEPESGFYHHTGGKPFRCAVCQKRFRYKNNVKRHMTTHTGEKPFTCSICGTKFARKSHLYDHHTARHTGVKPFTCSLCRKQFGCANNYKKHMRRHTQEKRPPSYVSAEGRPMKHNCSECGRTFGSGSILKRHLKVHTGEKPFRCSVCGQSFARNAHLINHMIRHTGEKPYSCSVCKKTFTRKDYVKVHMKVHTREEKGTETLAEENKPF
ncbi:zinc finger protein 771-like isoform X2 [Sphaeramia orbicularis]|uniref:zinc finger protein 771-like isoform X2 n=1 Tax=Sphaeramia orbicularis TaxID=375764 RepID=UPI00117CFEFA|nr:zinc finger protein 771-like isoform X2 [Sphaeramia orbicularis]